jgi:hypothetical protein
MRIVGVSLVNAWEVSDRGVIKYFDKKSNFHIHKRRDFVLIYNLLSY